MGIVVKSISIIFVYSLKTPFFNISKPKVNNAKEVELTFEWHSRVLKKKNIYTQQI